MELDRAGDAGCADGALGTTAAGVFGDAGLGWTGTLPAGARLGLGRAGVGGTLPGKNDEYEALDGIMAGGGATACEGDLFPGVAAPWVFLRVLSSRVGHLHEVRTLSTGSATGGAGGSGAASFRSGDNGGGNRSTGTASSAAPSGALLPTSSAADNGVSGVVTGVVDGVVLSDSSPSSELELVSHVHYHRSMLHQAISWRRSSSPKT